MIISVDRHVGLPFLEGLCSDLQKKIEVPQAEKPQPSVMQFVHEAKSAATRVATFACTLMSGLSALLQRY